MILLLKNNSFFECPRHKLVIAVWGEQGTISFPSQQHHLKASLPSFLIVAWTSSLARKVQILLMFGRRRNTCSLDSACIINLKPSIQIPDKRQHQGFIQVLANLKSFLDDNLKKGFILPSSFPLSASLFFFEKKKSSSLRIVHGNRLLNSITIQNYCYISCLLFHSWMFAFKKNAFSQLNLDGAYTLIWMSVSRIFNCFWHPIWKIWNDPWLGWLQSSADSWRKYFSVYFKQLCSSVPC